MLKAQKDSTYNETLRSFDVAATAYEKEDSDLFTFLGLLYEPAEQCSIDMTQYVRRGDRVKAGMTRKKAPDRLGELFKRMKKEML